MELTRTSKYDFASPELAKLYRGFLMAFACALAARVDLRACAVALQRRASAPMCGHAREQSVRVRWAEQNPPRVACSPMRRAGALEFRSDAAFCKEQQGRVDAALARRGGAFLRMGLGGPGARPPPCRSALMSLSRLATRGPGDGGAKRLRRRTHGRHCKRGSLSRLGDLARRSAARPARRRSGEAAAR